MKTIVLLERTYEELKNDSRILRTLQELTNLKHDVSIVLTRSGETKNQFFEINGIEIKHTNTLFNFIPYYVNPRLPKVVNSLFLRGLRHFLKPLVTFMVNRRIVNMLSNEKFDVCWANDFETLDYAINLKKHTKCLIVYDSHEYWSGRTGLTNRIYALYIKFKEKYIIKKHVDIIVSVNQEILELLKSGEKPSFCLYNIPSTKDISPINNYFHKYFNLEENKKILLYQGGWSEGRGIRFILNSIQAFPTDWIVVFMGSGILEKLIKDQIVTSVTQQVFLHPYVSPDKLLNYTSAANVGLCTIESLSISYRYALPNKFWEYLQAGVPIVSTRLPSMSSIQAAHHLGEEFDERNQEEFIKAIQSVLEKHTFYSEQIKKAQRVFSYESNVVHTYKNISDTLRNLLNDH